MFAVPGSPLDPRAEGTNGLIKQGATPVTEAADVISVLEPIMTEKKIPAREPEPLADGEASADVEPAPDERTRIVGLLGPRRYRSTIWCACRNRRRRSCEWSCSSLNSPGGSNATAAGSFR